ncbi:hypothetical protein BaRGS_00040596 [Batillaria attramentaria]|uniref:Deoxyuridine 5'-triphosphate nucleotidohydrolase n=1 Tax=Batillaria attramentaria TaxID=370345 RepID=A0ABD0J039_9CAEN
MTSFCLGFRYSVLKESFQKYQDEEWTASMVTQYEEELGHESQVLVKQYDNDCGYDFFFLHDDIDLLPGERKKLRTFVRCAMPDGYCGILKARSSFGSIGLRIEGGVIDPDFVGEIEVFYHNASAKPMTICFLDRPFQMVILKTYTGCARYVEDLDNPDLPARSVKGKRGGKGFGSSGGNEGTKRSKRDTSADFQQYLYKKEDDDNNDGADEVKQVKSPADSLGVKDGVKSPVDGQGVKHTIKGLGSRRRLQKASAIDDLLDAAADADRELLIVKKLIA